MKQETLEEAFEKNAKYLDDFENKNTYEYGFKDGAKWMQERSYSEEELKLPSKWKKWYKNNWNTSIEMEKQQSYSEKEVDSLFDTLKSNSIDNVVTITNVDLFISSWKQQFKKK